MLNLLIYFMGKHLKKKMIQEHGGKQTEAIKDSENKSKPQNFLRKIPSVKDFI